MSQGTHEIIIVVLGFILIFGSSLAHFKFKMDWLISLFLFMLGIGLIIDPKGLVS